jgi:hypothetical protein
LAFNHNSPTLQQYKLLATAFLQQRAPALAVDPFGWIGQSVTVYLDDDPAWDELAGQFRKSGGRLSLDDPLALATALQMPLGLQLEVTDGLKLIAFLGGTRKYLEEVAPGMLRWESRNYRDQPYTRVSLTEVFLANPLLSENGAVRSPSRQSDRSVLQALARLARDRIVGALDFPKFFSSGAVAEAPSSAQWRIAALFARLDGDDRAESAKMLQQAAIYYTASGDGLVITLRESVIQHAIDRWLERRAGNADKQAKRGEAAPLGKHLIVHADRKLLDVLGKIAGKDYQALMQQRAWDNLPILNEWKRLWPKEDPTAVQERLWQTGLVCPGGGRYVWNEDWQTMESTVYGHPDAPRTGPTVPAGLDSLASADFGLTFEGQGLRTRVILSGMNGKKPLAPAEGKPAVPAR